MENNNNKNVSLNGSMWLLVLLITVAFVCAQKADAAPPKDDKDIYPMDFMLGSDSAEGYLVFDPFVLTARPRTPSRTVRSQTPSRYGMSGASASVVGTPSGVRQTATAPIVTPVVATKVLVPTPKAPPVARQIAAPAPSVAPIATPKVVIPAPIMAPVAAPDVVAAPATSSRRDSSNSTTGNLEGAAPAAGDSRRDPIRIPYRPPLRSPYQLP